MPNEFVQSIGYEYNNHNKSYININVYRPFPQRGKLVHNASEPNLFQAKEIPIKEKSSKFKPESTLQVIRAKPVVLPPPQSRKDIPNKTPIQKSATQVYRAFKVDPIQEKIKQEEIKRQELKKQEEMRKKEELKKFEEKRRIEILRLEELQRLEELKRLEKAKIEEFRRLELERVELARKEELRQLEFRKKEEERLKQLELEREEKMRAKEKLAISTRIKKAEEKKIVKPTRRNSSKSKRKESKIRDNKKKNKSTQTTSTIFERTLSSVSSLSISSNEKSSSYSSSTSSLLSNLRVASPPRNSEIKPVLQAPTIYQNPTVKTYAPTKTSRTIAQLSVEPIAEVLKQDNLPKITQIQQTPVHTIQQNIMQKPNPPQEPQFVVTQRELKPKQSLHHHPFIPTTSQLEKQLDLPSAKAWIQSIENDIGSQWIKKNGQDQFNSFGAAQNLVQMPAKQPVWGTLFNQQFGSGFLQEAYFSQPSSALQPQLDLNNNLVYSNNEFNLHYF